MPSTVQSKARAGPGYTDRTGPIGDSGDSATATATATAAPTAMAPTMPIRPSAMVVPGAAPRARSTLRSSSAARSWREIICTPMRSAARAATAPKTPRAMAMGLTVRSTLAWTGAMA